MTICGSPPWRARLARALFTLTRRGAGWMAPPVCCLCAGAGQASPLSPWGLDLCLPCEQALPRLNRTDPRSGVPLPAVDAVWATHAYGPPLDTLVRDLKFRGVLPHARVLGMLMAARRLPAGALPDAVVPVPLGRGRFAERGFNQAQEIARHAARHLGLPLRPGLLRRVRETQAQSGLGADARRRNLAGAFVVGGQSLPSRIALVDDVLTTGSTVAAAARALKDAGAGRVEVWVAARVLKAGMETEEAE